MILEELEDEGFGDLPEQVQPQIRQTCSTIQKKVISIEQ
jgi:hypothetical protein